jgi:hypothetical protein
MRLFARSCIAICAFAIPFSLSGHLWAWSLTLLAIAGLLFASGKLKLSQD